MEQKTTDDVLDFLASYRYLVFYSLFLLNHYNNLKKFNGLGIGKIR